MFPLGSVALPGVGLPLQIFEPRYRALVMTCLTSDRLFGSVLIERGSEVGGGDERSTTGTLVRIVNAEESPDGRWSVVGVGLERLRVIEWLEDDPFPRCIAEPWPDEPASSSAEELVRQTFEAVLDVMARHGVDRSAMSSLPELSADVSIASFQLAALSPLGPLDRLSALNAPDPDSRLSLLRDSLRDQASLLDALDALDDGPPPLD